MEGKEKRILGKQYNVNTNSNKIKSKSLDNTKNIQCPKCKNKNTSILSCKTIVCHKSSCMSITLSFPNINKKEFITI